MQTKRIAPIALAAAVLSASAAAAVAQIGAMGPPATVTPHFNPSAPLTVPQPRETPVSPVTPGTVPGTTAGSGATSLGENPVTGQPCSRGGSLTINGAGTPPGAAVLPPGMAAPPEENPVGGPPPASVYAPGGAWNYGGC